MLKNYIITAWKVFLRRKSFTLINLFGICLTLTVIMVIVSILDNYLNPIGPEKTAKNYRVIERVKISNSDGSSSFGSSPGYKFLIDNVSRLITPELISFYTERLSVASYKNGIKKTHLLRRTDINYWKILDFESQKGRLFTAQEINDGQPFAIINQATEKTIFGESLALGQFIEVNGQRFQVIGVVTNISETENEAYSDIWVPYTTLPSTNYKQQMMGGWKAILYHSNSQLMEEIHKEYIHLLQNDFISTEPKRFNQASSGAYGKLELLVHKLFGRTNNKNSSINKMVLYMTLLTLLFMLLPSINMINLNVSRIMERASEIGVRRAFGASTYQLIVQFIIENIILTIVGGLISIILSLCVLQLIENSQLIPYAKFSFNMRVMTLSFLMILVFGILSGLYPALKMSRLDPVEALKGGE